VSKDKGNNSLVDYFLKFMGKEWSAPNLTTEYWGSSLTPVNLERKVTMKFLFWQLEFRISHSSKNRNRSGTFRYGKSSRISKHSDVQHSELSSWECAYCPSLTEEDEGVCWGALVIGLKGSYADLLTYRLIPDQLTGLHKQKASGNKIKIQV